MAGNVFSIVARVVCRLPASRTRSLGAISDAELSDDMDFHREIDL